MKIASIVILLAAVAAGFGLGYLCGYDNAPRYNIIQLVMPSELQRQSAAIRL